MFSRALPIGSIGGVSIRLHWSWLGALLLLIAALSQIYDGGADGNVAWLLACAAALLLFASVVLHELGHALVARRYELPVHAITLFALGGVTEIADAPPEPVRDFLVAVAGPAVSLLLALLGGLAWWAAPAPLDLLLLHLALTNGAIVIAFEAEAGTKQAPPDDLLLSAHYACLHCNESYLEPTPQLFSFNSPQGMCLECDGLGT
jgi:Zn-dependent protease